MKKFKLLFISIGLNILLGCDDNHQKNFEKDTTTLSHSVESVQQGVTKKDAVAKDTTAMSLSIDNFKKVPEEIEGCGCYFSASGDKFKRNEYLFVASYDSIGFMSVDKKLVKLKMASTTREPETFGDNDHIDIYSSDKYKVTVDIKYKKSSGEETWQNTGTITVESKDGQKAVKKFFGECGC